MRTFLQTFTLAGLGLAVLPSCGPDSIEAPPAWQKPPRYGQGGTDSPKPPDNRNRFGFTGQETPPENKNRFGGNNPPGPGTNNNPPGDAPPNAGSSGQQTAGNTPPAVKPPEKKTAPAVETMPYARGVPGNPLAVTLPSPYDKLGPISVEKYDASGNPTGEPMSPGTPVEIRDPNNPGKKIRFRVP
ncbi:MAG: hypothetical protein R3F31_02320 [Verrucomicrobiales bacterium]|nr:hypothetical protein [Verrucomicrobiae bacterium]MCP5552970.1 hypothetical protein [Akkermansiaceae bacterium]HRX52863.1 hypothetical protein [Verrucomicrobiales bacterium]